ncbi:MAG: MarR family transcriptional regulator [Chloroflexi bacterium]|nr:MarR family transcriptional regulator [Chloroflexota bacterium]
MPTIRDRILEYLKRHPEGADDDELTAALGLRRRQEANNYCRQMVQEGLIERRSAGGKIRNFAKGATPSALVKPEPKEVHSEDDKPWFWEGNVQARVEQHLRDRGYTILRTADTAAHERGKDIEAKKGSRLLWVTAKGYPVGTTSTPRNLQAGHWFKDAFFDILVWRGENLDADLAMAMPDFLRYHKLLEKVQWIRPHVNVEIFWVCENGSVLCDTRK